MRFALPNPRTLTVGFAVIVASANVRAEAATASAAVSPPLSAELATVVVTADHYDNAVGTSDAASQGVVRADMLSSRPLLRPGEVLETVPGLVVTQHSGDGKANQYFLRGFNLDHGTDFATTVDGLPVNMPTHAHGQGYSDLNFLIPELVQRIDYRKGPYFATNGDFSAAGSADILYRQAVEAPFVMTTVGSNGYRRLLATDSAVIMPGVTLLAAIEVMGNDGPWVLKEGLQRTNAVLKLSGGTEVSGWSTSLMAYSAHWDSTDQVPERLIQAGTYQGHPFGRFSAVDPTDGGETARTSLSGQWHDTDSTGTTQISAYALHYTLQLFSNFTYFMDRPTTGDQFSQQDARDVYGLSATRTFARELGSFQTVNELGVQSRFDQIRVGLFDTQERAITGTTRIDDVHESLVGVYGQSTIELAPKARTVIGLRADSLSANVSSLLQPLNSGNANKSLLSPKLALIFGPWAKTELFVDAGSGFHSNDARGMTATVDPKTGDAQQPVPGLVKAHGGELGVRTEVVPGMQSSLALWRLDFDSELTYSGDDGTTSPNGPSSRYGVEWSNHWVPKPWCLVDVDWAWTHARFKDSESDGITTGSYVPNSVDQVATGTITLKDFGPWSTSLTERYIGSGPLTSDNSVRSSASLITNLRVGRTLSKKTALTLDVLNLFDRRYNDIEYYYATQLPGEPNPVNGKVVHPGEPRSLRLTLKVSF